MMELIQLNEDVFTISDVLSPEECENYIFFAEYKGFEPAKVQVNGTEKRLPGIRNNDRILHPDEAMASKIWDRCHALIPSQIDDTVAHSLNEMFRFYRYEGSQRFNRHRDGTFKRSENEFSQLSFLIYLNDDFEGGETSFDSFKVTPQKGTALVFRHNVFHKGNQLISGTKYVLRTDVMYRKLASQN